MKRSRKIRNKWVRYIASMLCVFAAILVVGCGREQTASQNAEQSEVVQTPQSGVEISEETEVAEEPEEEPEETAVAEMPEQEPETLDPDGTYTAKEDVALYIHLYGELPQNFITKKEAQDLGWSGGSLEPYAPGKCIGGSRFGNYEGLLPEAKGRSYYECDIDTLGAKSRGAKRIVYSNDGLIYFTGDHYESFTLLYGEE